jgi:conjugative relaxase-like TrwC/TraI family protein
MKGLDRDGEPLVQLHANKGHRPGWDLTFSAPKPVSTLWALSSPEVRQAIEAAQQVAVLTALKYLEDQALVTRRGAEGIREAALAVAAMYEHQTSRNQDPQLHIHLLLTNLAVRQDGTTGTVESHPLYLHQLAAGAVYRAKLAATLHEVLGLKITRDEWSFGIDGVSKELVERFSTRRQEILQLLRDKSVPYTAAAAEAAALETRAVKGHVARKVLFARWRQAGEDCGFGEEQAAALVRRGQKLAAGPGRHESDEKQAVRIVRDAANELADMFLIFRERDLVKFAAVSAQHCAVAPEPVLARIAVARQTGELLEMPREGMEEPWLVTRASAELLAELTDTAFRLLQSRRFTLREEYVERCLGKQHELSVEQRQALRHITTDPGAFQCVDGLSGSGKTAVLKAAQQCWQGAGWQTIGLTVNPKAAGELQAETGIECRTLGSFFYQTDPTWGQSLKHHAWQILRAARHQSTFSLPSEALTSRTVVILDEASMAAAPDLNRLLRLADAAGAKVVLNGDERQLDAFRQPGAFAYLIEKFRAAKMGELHRQTEPWRQDAIRQLANGDLHGALTQYVLAGEARVCEDRPQAVRRLISRWQRGRAKHRDQALIIARTAKGAHELNLLAQEARRAKGELGYTLKQRLPGAFVYANDRVVFIRNSKGRGYRNGDFGTVEEINFDAMTIRLDRTERMGLFHRHVRITLPRSRYKDLQLGYALSTPQAQGVTAKRVFVLAELRNIQHGNDDDTRATYSQLTRATESTHVFLCSEEAGEELQELAKLAPQPRERQQQQERQQQDTQHQEQQHHRQHENVQETIRQQEQQQHQGPHYGV